VPGATDPKPILTYAADGFSYEFGAPLANLVTTDVRGIESAKQTTRPQGYRCDLGGTRSILWAQDLH
jgi:hypothetical protein